MARRKKKSSAWRALVAVGRGLWLVVENVFRGMVFVVRKLGQASWWVARGAVDVAKRRKEKVVKEKKRRQKKERFGDAVYRPMEVISQHKGMFDDFEERLRDESLIIAIAGKRGSGKSALGFSLMENVHQKTKRPCAVLGVPERHLPGWIESVEEIGEVRDGTVVLVDEGAVSFSSRASMSKKNKELGDLLAIARHKDLTLILVTQNTGMLDKNVLNLCDTVMLKQGSLLQKEMERPVIKKLYTRALPELEKLRGKERKAAVYVIDGDFEGLISVPLPSFWTAGLSKSRR